MRFIAGVVEECGGGVGIDWHGHRDRDFAVSQLAGGARGRRDAAARRRDRHRRARRQHADGHAARQSGADGLHRAGPVGAGRILRGSVGGDRRADSAELSRRREGRVPHGDRRARRGDHQGGAQERSRARRRGVFGRAAGTGRARAGSRRRADVGALERDLLAREDAGLQASDEIVDRILAEAKKSDAVLSEATIRGLLRRLPTNTNKSHRRTIPLDLREKQPPYFLSEDERTLCRKPISCRARSTC